MPGFLTHAGPCKPFLTDEMLRWESVLCLDGIQTLRVFQCLRAFETATIVTGEAMDDVRIHELAAAWFR